MRFMIIVKGSAESEAGAMPTDAQIAEMGRFHEELARAGVLLDASGLKPTSRGRTSASPSNPGQWTRCRSMNFLARATASSCVGVSQSA